MLICFNCTSETRDQLDRLVASGAYRDYGEVIAAAVRNQLLLEQEVATRGSLVIGDPDPLAPTKPVAKPPRLAATKATSNHRHARNGAPKTIAQPSALSPQSEATIDSPTIPALFRSEGFPGADTVKFSELPPDVWARGQTVPLDRWILGQQNRLLPAKANARALVRLFAEADKGLPIGKTAERVAAEAASLGDYLAALDAKLEAGRDDALATAFPITGEDSDKSRSRYANQFVAYQNSRGELSGLMIDLKLINVVTIKKERCIVPTKVAWAFASIPNPILDAESSANASPTEKFSADERAFLVEHIAKSVPAEAFAYRAILEAVQAGHNNPETIDAALKAHVAPDRAEALSQSFLASQRSGAVSRMSDLNLIERLRDGTRVSYAITEDGRAFLDLCTIPPK